MIGLNLTLAIAPALLLLLWAYRRDSRKPEPPKLVLRAFLLGIAAIVVAVIAGLLLQPLEDMMRLQLRLVFDAYVVAGLLEESAKLAVVLFFVARHEEFDEVTDGLVYTMAASLGFAAVENILYLGDPASVLLVRGFTAVPLHASAGALLGFYVGLSRIEQRGSVLPGLLFAVLLHGTYDYLLFSGNGLATIPLLVAAVIVVRGLFVRAKKLDEAAGRI